MNDGGQGKEVLGDQPERQPHAAYPGITFAFQDGRIGEPGQTASVGSIWVRTLAAVWPNRIFLLSSVMVDCFM